MKLSFVASVIVMVGLASATTVDAQLTAASEGPIVYGHHHLNVTNLEEHKRFWVDTLGGTAIPWGDAEIVKFSNVFVFMREQAPSGGTKGTTVDHIGFSVPSVRAVVDHVLAAGYPVVSREEYPPILEVTDGVAYIPEQDTHLAFVMAPDNVKVELLENPTQTVPITLHHIHFATRQLDEMKAWYVETFNAVPGMRGQFQAADLPGVNLTFSSSPDQPVGTQGRSLDHIGFEVDGLEAFCKTLEAKGVVFDRPYRKIEARGIAIAFFTDPFGTYIELTEGLDKL